jgi:hypothetical protein
MAKKQPPPVLKKLPMKKSPQADEHEGSPDPLRAKQFRRKGVAHLEMGKYPKPY